MIAKVGGELIDSALNLYRSTPLKTIFTVKEAREYLNSLPPEEQKYAREHPIETGFKFAGIQMLQDVGTILKPLSNTGYAVGGIASGEGPLEGILNERIVSEELGIVDEDTSFWEWKKPERAVAGFLTDVVTDPLSWVGVGLTKKLSMLKDMNLAKLWQSAVKEMPEFLKDDSAVSGFIKKVPEETRVTDSPKIDISAPSLTEQQAWEGCNKITDEPVSSKDIWKKIFVIKKEIAKKEAQDPYANLKRTGLVALGVTTGVSAAAVGLAGLLDEQQQEEIKKVEEAESISLPAPITPETATSPQAPLETGEPSMLAKLGETAMGVRSEVMSSPLGPAVGAGWGALEYVMDKLQTFSYAEGGLIKSAQTVLDNPADWNKWKFYGYQWKMTPADVFGVYDPDDPISLRTVAGLGIDIGLDPLTYFTLENSAAVKIGSTSLGRVALNPKGIKTLKKLSDVHGEKNAEQIFSDMLTDPKFRKQVQAAEGVSLRG